MLFKEIIAVYCENHVKPINTKWKVISCWSRWDIELPLGFKGLNRKTGFIGLWSREYVKLWDLRILRRWKWRWWSSCLWFSVELYIDTNISDCLHLQGWRSTYKSTRLYSPEHQNQICMCLIHVNCRLTHKRLHIYYVCCSPAQVVKVLYAVAILFSYGLQFYIPTTIAWPDIEQRIPKGFENIAQIVFRIVTIICTGKNHINTAYRTLSTDFNACSLLHVRPLPRTRTLRLAHKTQRGPGENTDFELRMIRTLNYNKLIPRLKSWYSLSWSRIYLIL
jgi:hypothetical protein